HHKPHIQRLHDQTMGIPAKTPAAGYDITPVPRPGRAGRLTTIAPLVHTAPDMAVRSQPARLALAAALVTLALSACAGPTPAPASPTPSATVKSTITRSEEHTSELQSRGHLVCRLLLEKKKTLNIINNPIR